MFGIDDAIGAGLGVIGKIIDRVIPDKEAQDKAKLALLEMQQRGELAQLDAALKSDLGQMDINKQEAASSSLFVAGWRPMVGWVCAGALAYSFILLPMLRAILAAWKPGLTIPSIDMSDLWPLMMGMLGLGGMRSWEKAKGVSR